jgi:hypothetical protein
VFLIPIFIIVVTGLILFEILLNFFSPFPGAWISGGLMLALTVLWWWKPFRRYEWYIGATSFWWTRYLLACLVLAAVIIGMFSWRPDHSHDADQSKWHGPQQEQGSP